MTKAPCLVCGQQDHSFLEWVEIQPSEWKIVLRCPISMSDTWEDFLQSKDTRVKYGFKAEKLLSKYGYCEEEVLQAFDAYEQIGYGRILKFQSPVLHRVSRDALIMLCQNARHLHQFTRETKYEDEIDDEDETDDDSDPIC